MNHLDDDTLNEYLDYALDASAHVDAEMHLQTCPACREKLDELHSVFSELEALPEAHLEHDLVPDILTCLPGRKPFGIWTRAFAVQIGVAVGTFFWLAMQVNPFVRVPRLTFPALQSIDLQTLLACLLALQFLLPEMRFPAFSYQLQIFDIQFPALGFQLSIAHVTVLTISALLLWLVGNAILLRSRPEASS